MDISQWKLPRHFQRKKMRSRKEQEISPVASAVDPTLLRAIFSEIAFKLFFLFSLLESSPLLPAPSFLSASSKEKPQGGGKKKEGEGKERKKKLILKRKRILVASPAAKTLLLFD